MLKMHNKIIDGLLVPVVALGLAGCAINGNVATRSTTHSPSTVKVTKQNNHRATTQTKATSDQQSETSSNNNAKVVANTSNKVAATTQEDSAQHSTSATTPVTNTQSSKTNTQIGQRDIATWTDQYGVIHHVDANGLDYQTINGSVQTHYEQSNGQVPANAQIINNVGPNKFQKSDKYKQPIQLGLGDVATWTDQYGVVHHVDSDGMDRQTIPGSSQVHYADWSAALPENAQVIHNN